MPSSTDKPTFALEALHLLSAPLDQLRAERDARTLALTQTLGAREVVSEDRGKDAFTKAKGADEVLDLSSVPSKEQLLRALDALPHGAAELQGASATSTGLEAEERLIGMARVTAGTYALVLDQLVADGHRLSQAAWEWEDIGGSRSASATYLVQTLPQRLVNVLRLASRMASEAAQTTLSVADQSSRESQISQLLSRSAASKAWKTLSASPILVRQALFPLSAPGAQQLGSLDAQRANPLVVNTTSKTKRSHKSRASSSLRALRHSSPLHLASHEAEAKRLQAVEERQDIAEKLGILAIELQKLTTGPPSRQGIENETARGIQEAISQQVALLQSVLARGGVDDRVDVVANQPASSADLSSSVGTLRKLLTDSIPSSSREISILLSPSPAGLGSPSFLARAWPTLVLTPLISMITLRAVLRNWDAVKAQVQDAKETLRGFVVGWVWNPVMGLLDTLREGDKRAMIMTAESLNSDVQSLERMVVEFAGEKQTLSATELAALSSRVREGDLSEVLKVYEQELKSPLKSAVTGSLVRSLLIQIQKAKVDIETAMAGIDRLLKSQQLLFGAVGVAPAMGAVYLVYSWSSNRVAEWSGRRGRQAGRQTRARVWEAMRYVLLSHAFRSRIVIDDRGNPC
ncbi:NCA2-domain-containing protein [Ceraceosorus guamensis]|uniref:NCA2-domain-containing protein n=1 Tax=Ceraceosorus guamensis TaxID=1522189 RepID=A0A316W651_9BASI|nr:NCA2-domain-containing protein [Ceraceosorus guamensis]PWN45396.1 NCA2-domain-containing protein [Ceraceosorus guamensis]